MNNRKFLNKTPKARSEGVLPPAGRVVGKIIALLWLAGPAWGAERVVRFTAPTSNEGLWTCLPTSAPRYQSGDTVFSSLATSTDHVFSFRPHTHTPHPDLVPCDDEIFAWISAIVGQGERRAGDPANHWTEDYVAGLFSAWGLVDVAKEAVPLDRWLPGETDLIFTGTAATVAIPAFPFASVDWTTAVEAPVLRFTGLRDLDAVEGRVVVVDYRLNSLDLTAPMAAAIHVYDPDQDLVDTTHLIGMPHAAATAELVTRILDRRPTALIAILANYFAEGKIYGVHDPDDPTVQIRRIPCLWVSPQHLSTIDACLTAGPASARIQVRASTQPVVTHNVIARLSGPDNELVQIASHHDGAFTSATEDAAGVAMVLAQARYWSRVPVQERPHSLQFLLTSGHLRGAEGEEAYLAAHPERADQTVLDVHLETPAREYTIVDGRLTDLNRPEPRNIYVSLVSETTAALIAGVQEEELRRCLLIPDDAFTQPRCAAGRFFLAGIPVIGYLGGPPVYYFDQKDTLDKVDRNHLAAITRLMIRAIASTAGHSAQSMRAARRVGSG